MRLQGYRAVCDFVEDSLKHVPDRNLISRTTETRRRSRAEKKTALDQAISDTDEHIRHLTGDVMTPGSILAYVEKEKQLKTGISSLDTQLLDDKTLLYDLPPQALQEEIDAEIRKKTEISIGTVLELVGMAAGFGDQFRERSQQHCVDGQQSQGLL